MDQVLIWRRSYDTRPRRSTPTIRATRATTALRRSRAAGAAADGVPEGHRRTLLALLASTIAPAVKAGQRVIIAAHGNSLRALVKYLDRVTDKDILELNIPTGIPLVYELKEDLTPIRSYYLGDPAAVQKAAQAVADQLKKSKS